MAFSMFFSSLTFLVTLVFFTNIISSSVINADGNVGCLLSKKLCRKQEWCHDDFAFGRCLPHHHNKGQVQDQDLYRYSLDIDALKQLEQEFRRLFLEGYRWAHSYTQCIVKKLLHSFRYKVNFERNKCNNKEDDDLARALQFLEAEHKVDPKDLAVIKFQPSLVDPQTEYGDEIYSPLDGYEDDGEQQLGADGSYVGVMKNYAIDGKTLPTTVEELPWSTMGGQKFKRKEYKTRDDEEDYDVQLTDKQLEELGSLIMSYANEDVVPLDFEYPINTQDDNVGDEEEETWSFAKHKGRKHNKNIRKFVPDENDIKENEDNEGDQLLYMKNFLRLDPTVAFERPHRYDVKKPGPYFKVNNYIFEKEKAKNKNDYVSNEPVIFKYHPMFEEKDPSDSTFRHHHLVEEPIAMTAEGMPSAVEDEGDEGDRGDTVGKNDSGTEATKRNNYINKEFLMDYGNLNNNNNNDDDGVGFGDVDGLPKVDYPSYDDFSDFLAISQPKKENFYLKDMFPLGEDYTVDDIRSNPLETYETIENPYYLMSLMDKQQESEDVKHLFDTNKDEIEKKNLEINGPVRLSEPKGTVSNGSPKTIHNTESHVQAKFSKLLSQEHLPETNSKPVLETVADRERFDIVDTSCVYLVVDKGFKNHEGQFFVKTLESLLNLPPMTFTNIRPNQNQVMFKVNSKEINGSVVANRAEKLKDELLQKTGKLLTSAGIGDKTQLSVEIFENDNRMFIVTFVVCGVIAGAVIAVGALYVVRRHARSREKLQNLTQLETEASQDYQDLCRQRMASKSSEKPEPVTVPQRVSSLSRESETSVRSPSSRSSTSSWNEEPVVSNMDISTGHMVLSYMEDHLTNKDRLDQEWIALCAYEADPCSTNAAIEPNNIKKNRYEDILPYDHSRVVLNDLTNIAGSDYINASTITDHDPRNPAYIATQGPLPHTSADFWQMIWEQGSVVLVMLTRLVENGVAMCHRYWPEEGSELYHIYEVHLVSEHIWCEDYLVRSFYLKNLKTGETRTVTQFHFLSWPDNGVPNATKALLDFRRKVNKSYRGRSCPIVVHCSDGIGRTGTYCLIDMVLNRMAKGAKEIDIAATLEHIRDQRNAMVRTKTQFEFALMSVADEVHAILKALPQ